MSPAIEVQLDFGQKIIKCMAKYFSHNLNPLYRALTPTFIHSFICFPFSQTETPNFLLVRMFPNIKHVEESSLILKLKFCKIDGSQQ